MNTADGIGPTMIIQVGITAMYIATYVDLIKTEGNIYYEWDQPGGSRTAAPANQDSRSVTSRQSASGAALSRPDDVYRHQVPIPNSGHHATRPDPQRPAALDYSQGDANDRPAFDRRPSDAGYSRPVSQRRVDSGVYIGTGATNHTIQSTWGQETPHGTHRGPAGRKTGRESISNRNEAASSKSDASTPHGLVEDLQGLSLGDHPTSHIVPTYGESSQSHRNDPILGDAQRRYDSDVGHELTKYLCGPGYQRQREAWKFFRVGKVFSMLYHENAGSHGTVLSQQLSPFTTGKYGESIYSSIRRMVVVRERKGCCWCIPIATYGGQGVAKSGVDVPKHAVIYMRGDEPHSSRAEPRMIKEPLEVEPAKADQKLDRMSRVNFGKIYTVEHNVKVLPVGKITEASQAKFLEYANYEFLR
ncbi:hypothetical protein N7457_008723 [Penicillium paradoxum]|uniref:uncharacterized protein n=1 Tax=Penicillium paradoxum TaxID=176176 RepID=UPI00254754BA|nr:uncharacterized protein N7457_008723 [Penicillium paradoxum]KAJ5773827.1 hypothetical protein N7457_008723 [Penicillium paradoxum]